MMDRCGRFEPSNLVPQCSRMFYDSWSALFRTVRMTGFPSRLPKFRLRLPTRRFLSSTTRLDDAQQTKKDHAYCVKLVSERDREGYLCGLLMPSAAQKSYFAIRAFNVELACIKDGHHLRAPRRPDDNTPASLALQMRMQWWRDALDEIYDKDQKTNNDLQLSVSCWHNPVVRALYSANQQSHLTQRFLQRLIDAREADLHLNQFDTIQDAETYAEESVSSLLYLSLECTGVRDDDADVVASLAGVGIGLATALRATPFRLQHGEVPLPASLFPKEFPYHDVVRTMTDDPEQLDDTNAQIWDQAVRHMATTASNHLSRAQELQSQVPRQGRTALLPVIPAVYYLSRLQEANYNLFAPELADRSKQLKLLLLLMRTWLTGVF